MMSSRQTTFWNIYLPKSSCQHFLYTAHWNLYGPMKNSSLSRFKFFVSIISNHGQIDAQPRQIHIWFHMKKNCNQVKLGNIWTFGSLAHVHIAKDDIVNKFGAISILMCFLQHNKILTNISWRHKITWWSFDTKRTSNKSRRTCKGHSCIWNLKQFSHTKSNESCEKTYQVPWLPCQCFKDIQITNNQLSWS
jgi:hypothetical protein